MKIIRAYILICISVIILFISSCSTSNLSVGTVRVKNKPVAENNNKQPEPLASTDNSFIPIQPQTKTDTSFASAANHILDLKQSNLSVITYHLSKKERLRKFVLKKINVAYNNYHSGENKDEDENKSLAITSTILGFAGLIFLLIGALLLGTFGGPFLLVTGLLLILIAIIYGIVTLVRHEKLGMTVKDGEKEFPNVKKIPDEEKGKKKHKHILGIISIILFALAIAVAIPAGVGSFLAIVGVILTLSAVIVGIIAIVKHDYLGFIPLIFFVIFFFAFVVLLALALGQDPFDM